MNDSFNKKKLKGLRAEWSMLVHSFLEEELLPAQLLSQVKDTEISVVQVKALRKELSAKRKKMNQSIEKIKSKLEKVSSVIENLELVGSDASGLVKEVHTLNHEGEHISETIMKLDSKIKKLHEIEEALPKNNLVLQNQA